MTSLALLTNSTSSLISAIRNPGLSALRRKHDGVQLSRSLSLRLASGVGAGDLRWIEE